MPAQTLLITGPGGIGKGPADRGIKDGVARLDPYRLRVDGHPRDSGDSLYAHPNLRLQLERALEAAGDSLVEVGMVRWFPRSRVAIFPVRKDWQVLFVGDVEAELAKGELFAPILPDLLSIGAVREHLGCIHMIILNPAPGSVTSEPAWGSIEERTGENCRKRGDTEADVRKRVDSIAKTEKPAEREAPAWARLLNERNAREYPEWQFPEHLYQGEPEWDEAKLLRHQQDTLIAAVARLLAEHPELECFFKTEEQIRRIAEPFVKRP